MVTFGAIKRSPRYQECARGADRAGRNVKAAGLPFEERSVHRFVTQFGDSGRLTMIILSTRAPSDVFPDVQDNYFESAFFRA